MYNFGGGNSFKINSLTKRAISTFFAVIFFFALGAIVDSREASGQCPGGYSATTIFMTVNYPAPNNRSCNYTVVLCFRCSPGGGNPHNMYPILISSGNCNLGIPLFTGESEIFLEALQQAMFEKYLSLCSYPPCPMTAFEEVARVPKCWFLENDAINSQFLLKSCDDIDSFCIKTNEVCMDYSVTPPEKQIISTTSQSIGLGLCSPNFPTIPLDVPHGWQSECFNLYPNCP